MTLRGIACLLLVLTFSIAANAGDRKFIVKPRSGDRKALPFSEAVLVGNTLYIAGHIGLDAKTDMPPASAEDEARLVMDGIKQTVESAGMSMDDVVSMQVTSLHGRSSAPTNYFATAATKCWESQ